MLSVDKRNETTSFRKVRPYNNSYELNHWLAPQCGRKTYLSFSCGKDSVVCWLHMKELECWENIIPVYYYLAPGLEFVEESLSYYENFFGTSIIRLPSPNLLSDWSGGILQTPETFRTIKSMREYFFPCNFDDLDDWIRKDNGDDTAYMATGMRMYDGPNRLAVIRSNGGLREDKRKFCPVFDWKIQDVVNCLKHHNCKLPSDYLIWGKSFDGTDYRFISQVKKNFPRDYERIRDCYPLLDLSTLRYRTIEAPLLIEQPDKFI